MSAAGINIAVQPVIVPVDPVLPKPKEKDPGCGLKEIALAILLALGAALLAVGIWAIFATALPHALTLFPSVATALGLTAAKAAYVGVGLLLAVVSSYFLFFQKKTEEVPPAPRGPNPDLEIAPLSTTRT